MARCEGIVTVVWHHDDGSVELVTQAEFARRKAAGAVELYKPDTYRKAVGELVACCRHGLKPSGEADEVILKRMEQTHRKRAEKKQEHARDTADKYARWQLWAVEI